MELRGRIPGLTRRSVIGSGGACYTPGTVLESIYRYLFLNHVVVTNSPCFPEDIATSRSAATMVLDQSGIEPESVSL